MVLDLERTGAKAELKMSKLSIGLIFDGETEIAALPTRLDRRGCIFHTRKRTLNGNSVTLTGISNECVRILKALSSAGATVSFILVDREDRSLNVGDMESELTKLISRDFTGEFYVIVANRMFENWIIADIENLALKNPELIDPKVVNGKRDGINGVSFLKDHWNKKNSSYSKIAHGKKLFKEIRLGEARANSPSFDCFVSYLTARGVTVY